MGTKLPVSAYHFPTARYQRTYAFADYVAGKDPALELALTIPTPPTIDEALPSGVQGTLAAYRAYETNPLHKYLPDLERRINALGYKLLAEKQVQDAIVVFEVNAQTHPNSWNAMTAWVRDTWLRRTAKMRYGHISARLISILGIATRNR